MIQTEKNNCITLLAVITILLTGISGLITYFLLTLFSNVDIGRDPDIKHGLASGASRLGGVAIIFSILLSVMFTLYIYYELTLDSFFHEFNLIIVFSVLTGFIGLAEDLSQKLSSITRLLLTFLIVCLGLSTMPELVPLKINIFYPENAGLHEPFIFVFTIFMICGFINAGNIADGANGLLSSIILAFFILVYSLDSSIINLSILLTMIAFVIYNVANGRIFLGDFGSYSLSALVAYKSLELYLMYDVAIFCLASILIYPSFEIVRSLIFRIATKASLMDPDNHHLHNYVGNFIKSSGFSNHSSNSMTGLGIAFSTVALPLFLFMTQELSDDYWAIIFSVEMIFLSLIYSYFYRYFSKKNS